MKGVLEFNLPEETQEFELAQNGIHYSIVLDDLDLYLRNKIKYGGDSITEEQMAVYEEIRKELWTLRSDREI